MKNVRGEGSPVIFQTFADEAQVNVLIKLAAIIGLACIQPGIHAAEYKTSLEHRKCTNAVSPGETEGEFFAACDMAELKRQDVLLNERYNRLRSMLAKEQVPILIKGQKAWLRQREDWCQFERTLSGSSPAQNYAGCILESTLRQIETLELSIQRVE